MENKLLRIAIIDYGLCNLFSVKRACEIVGMEAVITSEKEDIQTADGIILPGVGAFGDAVGNLQKLDLVSFIVDLIASGKPFFGICLGMHLLMEESEEFGNHKGLGVIRGNVKKFPNKNADGKLIKVPQIGWNQISPPKSNAEMWKNSPLENTIPGEFMYFVHSYYSQLTDEKDVFAITDYEGIEYCSSIKRQNVHAFQFHPEKSASAGLNIYKKWYSLIKKNGEKL